MPTGNGSFSWGYVAYELVDRTHPEQCVCDEIIDSLRRGTCCILRMATRKGPRPLTVATLGLLDCKQGDRNASMDSFGRQGRKLLFNHFRWRMYNVRLHWLGGILTNFLQICRRDMFACEKCHVMQTLLAHMILVKVLLGGIRQTGFPSILAALVGEPIFFRMNEAILFA